MTTRWRAKGEKIVSLRGRLGWSQADLVGRSGISKSTLERYEGGGMVRRFEPMENVAQALTEGLKDQGFADKVLLTDLIERVDDPGFQECHEAKTPAKGGGPHTEGEDVAKVLKSADIISGCERRYEELYFQIRPRVNEGAVEPCQFYYHYWCWQIDQYHYWKKGLIE